MEVDYCGSRIQFKVSFKKRKTLKISVKPDLSVEVIAPLGITNKKVCEIVLKKANWILKKKKELEGNPYVKEELQYLDGEEHWYLGKGYKINVIKASRNCVKLENENIYIYTINNNKEYNKNLLYKWYRKNAQIEFENLFEECFEKFTKYNFKKPTLSIRKMKARWGSYRPYKNHVTLNLELIKKNSDLIKYVIIHELCHVKHPNHSKKFYEFMESILPEWREKKIKLDKGETYE